MRSTDVPQRIKCSFQSSPFLSFLILHIFNRTRRSRINDVKREVIMPSADKKPKTLYDKVFQDHVVNEQGDGPILLYIGMALKPFF